MKRRLLLFAGFLILALVSLIHPAPGEGILRKAKEDANKRRAQQPGP